MPKHQRTAQQTIAIGKLLEKYLHRPGPGEQYWKYEEGWSDKAVSAHVQGVNSIQVSNLRLQLYGPIGPQAGNKSVEIEAVKAEMKAAHNLLVDAVNVLVKRVDDLTKRHDQLCETLSINRVADVRHLGKERT